MENQMIENMTEDALDMKKFTAYIYHGTDVKIETSTSLRRLRKIVATYLLNNPADKVTFEAPLICVRRTYQLIDPKGKFSEITGRLYFAEWLMNTVTEVI